MHVFTLHLMPDSHPSFSRLRLLDTKFLLQYMSEPQFASGSERECSRSNNPMPWRELSITAKEVGYPPDWMEKHHLVRRIQSRPQ